MQKSTKTMMLYSVSIAIHTLSLRGLPKMAIGYIKLSGPPPSAYCASYVFDCFGLMHLVKIRNSYIYQRTWKRHVSRFVTTADDCHTPKPALIGRYISATAISLRERAASHAVKFDLHCYVCPCDERMRLAQVGGGVAASLIMCVSVSCFD